MEGYIVFITEIKLYLKNKKESFIEKWDNFEYDRYIYNQTCNENGFSLRLK